MPPTSGRASADTDHHHAGNSNNNNSEDVHHPSQVVHVSNNSTYTPARGRGSSARNEDDDGKVKQPTPLFERLVTEEVQELKTYARIIESQQRRLEDLELVHGDLEQRLEVESRGRQQLEATLEAREREWANKFEELRKDRDHWKEVVTVEQTKNSRLIDQVVRKDQDIHRMLQRKYDNDIRSSVRNIRQQTTDRGERTVASASKSPESRADIHKSPHEILAASGSAEKVRRRNVKSMLFDFFGM